MSTFLANVANTVNYFILPRVALDTGNLVWQLLNPEVIVKILFLSVHHLVLHTCLVIYLRKTRMCCIRRNHEAIFCLAHTYGCSVQNCIRMHDV